MCLFLSIVEKFGNNEEWDAGDYVDFCFENYEHDLDEILCNLMPYGFKLNTEFIIFYSVLKNYFENNIIFYDGPEDNYTLLDKFLNEKKKKINLR